MSSDILHLLKDKTESALTVSGKYLILRGYASYKHTQVMKRGKPKIQTGKVEIIFNSNYQMEDLIKRIRRDKNLKHLVEVLDLEIISEHGYTIPPRDTSSTAKEEQPKESGKPTIQAGSGFQLREYQEDMTSKGVNIIQEHGLVIYALEMRLGKSHISLETAKRIGAKKVLFLTPKAAITSVQEDYETAGHTFDITVTNYEQLKPRFDEFKKAGFDLIICDEFHKLGAYPKPTKKTSYIQTIGGHGAKFIFLSGTPTPESFSQIYHSLSVSPMSPFRAYNNFYAWAKDFVEIYTIKVQGRDARQYNRAKETEVKAAIKHLFLSYTQEEAGFNHQVKDQIHVVKMSDSTYSLAKALKRDEIVRTKDGGVILGDQPAKMMSALHQIYSGTIKYEKDGEELRRTFDRSKIEYLKEKLLKNRDLFTSGAKTAIFYCFVEEGNALRAEFPNAFSDPDEFERADEGILISQVRTVREGVNISSAETIIFYNIGFSYTDYAQARQRHQAKDKVHQPVSHFLFSDKGLERKIYKRVLDKKEFTVAYFKKVIND